MKHIKIACLSLLLIAKAGIATAQTKADIPEQSSPTRSLSARHSSNKFLETLREQATKGRAGSALAYSHLCGVN